MDAVYYLLDFSLPLDDCHRDNANSRTYRYNVQDEGNEKPHVILGIGHVMSRARLRGYVQTTGQQPSV